MEFFLSIVIPAYNEQFYIKNTLDNLLNYFRDENYNVEIFIVNDGSTDRTKEVTLEYIKTILDSPELIRSGKIKFEIIDNVRNLGKGFSVKNGVLKTQGKFILFTDADLSTPIEELKKLLHYLNNGYDIAIGSRDLPESNITKHQNIFREFMGKSFNMLVRKTVKLNFKDTQCGFKLFSREAAFLIFPKMNIGNFGFDVELLYIAEKLGLKIKEVPVKWTNNEDSKVNIVKDSLKMLLSLLKVTKMHKDI